MSRVFATVTVFALMFVVSAPPSAEAQGLLKRLLGKKRSCVTRTTCHQTCHPPCLQCPMSTHGIPCLCDRQFQKERNCCLRNHPEGSQARQFCLWAAEERYNRCMRGPKCCQSGDDPDCPPECSMPNYGCDGLPEPDREYCIRMYEAICDDCDQ